MTIIEEAQQLLKWIREKRALAKKATLGPWYVGADYASDCPPHENSGLALVDTGRSADWTCARLCEWPTATFIADARTTCPLALDMLETAIEGFMEIVAEGAGNSVWAAPKGAQQAERRLADIIAQWKQL